MNAAPILLGIARNLTRWRKERRSRPLAAWAAWHSHGTSQRELVQLLALYRIVLALGGNRSGKTEWLRAVAVAMALGSDHPDARIFWRRNGVDPDSMPKGPGKVWILARRSNDSINYHRRQIDRLLPGGGEDSSGMVTWWNKNGKGEARVEIRVPGYDLPAEIVFKSEDQGEDAAQGDSCRLIAHDEEGDTANVWDECSVRLWDQRGYQIMANTPIKGRTWIYHRFVEKTPHGVAVRWIHSLDNPFLPPEDAKKLEENKAVAAARLRGEFVVLKGRIWPAFSRGTHTIEPFEIPRDWPRFRAIDFGTANPFACLWATLAPRRHVLPGGRVIEDGTLIVYREHYQAGWVLSQHVTAIRLAEGWDWVNAPDGSGILAPVGDVDEIDMTWADPEDPQQLATLNVDYDMGATPASNAVAAGIDRVSARLQAGTLLVFTTCPHTIREVEGYQRKPDRSGIVTEAPLKKDDHTCDAVRYLTMGAEQW